MPASSPRPPKLAEIWPAVVSHLRELRSRRDAWPVLVRNAVPLVGVYGFGWSAALLVFSYWFDGLSALAAIIAAMVPRAMREGDARAYARRSAPVRAVIGVLTWLVLVGIVGLPYWVVLIPLAPWLGDRTLWRELATSPALWLSFGVMLSLHFWNAFRRGYDTLPERELKQRARSDVYLLALRAVAMFVVASNALALLLVPIMALVLSYLEIWPQRALGAVFGDPAKLYEDHDDPKLPGPGPRARAE